MDVIVTLEQRFCRTPDGAVWADAAFTSGFWQRYLDVFDGVKVVARVAESPAAPVTAVRADRAGVAFIPIPYYVGGLQYARRAIQVRAAINRVCCEASAVVMRVPSFIASPLTRKLRRMGHPYGVEVVGDPYDVFAPGAMRHPLRPYLRWSLTRQLQQQCKAACAAAYVTEYTLQQRYPCSRYSVGVSDIVLSSTTPLNDAVFETHFSSIDLQQDAYAKEPRRYPRDATRPAIRLLTVGSLEQRYKGVHVLLEALQHCASRGLDATLTVVGDGRYRNELERQTGKLNLAPRVMFLGKLQPGAAVRAEMDKADVFILASLTEGLPRVMIEAMARAMPCIGTHVGGVPELLLQEDMATPGDAGALAGKIMEVAASEARMRKMSAYNLAKAREFHEPILAERRSLFYRHLRSAMENWLAERKALTRRLA